MLLSPPGIQPELQEQPSRPKRNQPKWPRIIWSEYSIIHDRGARYQGFVDYSTGSVGGSFFDDMIVDTWFYHDPKAGHLRRLWISTEGGKSPKGLATLPEEIKSYRTLVQDAGINMEHGYSDYEIIHGPYKRGMSQHQKRALARRVHEYVRKNFQKMKLAKLQEVVRAMFV